MSKFISILLLSLLVSSTAHAQVPVTDAVSIADRAVKHAEALAQWGAQLQQLEGQLRATEQQLEAAVGNRGFGRLHDSADIRAMALDVWQSDYQKDMDPESGRESPICRVYGINEQKELCERALSQDVTDAQLLSQTYAQAIARGEQIRKLMSEINATSDPKGISELQARIAAEQAFIASEQVRLELFKAASSIEGEHRLREKREVQAKLNERRGLAPLTYEEQ